MFAQFGPDEKLDSLEFSIHEHKEYLARSAVEYLFSPESPNQKYQSPRMTKTAGPQRQQRQGLNAAKSITLRDLPDSPVNGYGLTKAVFDFLEVRFSRNRARWS